MSSPAFPSATIIRSSPRNGFKPLNQSDIKLLVNQTYRADFRLDVGSVSQTVNVQGQPVQVETTSNQIGNVIEDTKITALPLNGRSYIDLLGLQAGVVAVGSRQSQLNFPKPADGLGNVGNLSVNGMQESANEFVVNGSSAQEVVNNGAAIVPVLDSIQEFRLLTNTFDAEYGHSAGAIVNVVPRAAPTIFTDRVSISCATRRLTRGTIFLRRWEHFRATNMVEPSVAPS